MSYFTNTTKVVAGSRCAELKEEARSDMRSPEVKDEAELKGNAFFNGLNRNLPCIVRPPAVSQHSTISSVLSHNTKTVENIITLAQFLCL